jgi:hypothetical protein
MGAQLRSRAAHISDNPWSPLNRSLPPARLRLLDKLKDMARL